MHVNTYTDNNMHSFVKKFTWDFVRFLIKKVSFDKLLIPFMSNNEASSFPF